MAVLKRIGSMMGVYGPSPKNMVEGTFTTSGGTGALTAVAGEGFTAARQSQGVFRVTYARVAKAARKVVFSVQGASTAQLFIITANTTAYTEFTQVTAGGGTAVDTMVATVHFHAVERYTS